MACHHSHLISLRTVTTYFFICWSFAYLRISITPLRNRRCFIHSSTTLYLRNLQSTRPKTEKICERDNCESLMRNTVDITTSPHEQPKIRWAIGPWSDCSRTCGNGTQRRLVVCRDHIRDLSDVYCQHLERVESTRHCMIKPCAQWTVGPWKPVCLGTFLRLFYLLDHYVFSYFIEFFLTAAKMFWVYVYGWLLCFKPALLQFFYKQVYHPAFCPNHKLCDIPN